MSELVSTPGSEISAAGVDGSLEGSPLDCPWHVDAPEPRESARTTAADA
jgi:hypothetical protein